MEVLKMAGLLEDVGGFTGFALFAMIGLVAGGAMYMAVDKFGNSLVGAVRSKTGV